MTQYDDEAEVSEQEDDDDEAEESEEEDDDKVKDFIKPIFEETTNHLVGDRLQEMRFEDADDEFLFTGVISCENRDRNHSRVPTCSAPGSVDTGVGLITRPG